MIRATTDIVIGNCSFKGVEMEGLSELEITSAARAVTERMNRLTKERDIVDSRKLALMAALELAAELQQLQTAAKDVEAVLEGKLDAMITALESSMDSAGPGAPK